MLILFDGLAGGWPIPYMGHNYHNPGSNEIRHAGDFANNYLLINNKKQDLSGPYKLKLADAGWVDKATSAALLQTNRRSNLRWWTGQTIPAVLNLIVAGIAGIAGLPLTYQPVEILWLPYPSLPGFIKSKNYLILHQPFLIDAAALISAAAGNIPLPPDKRQVTINSYLEVFLDVQNRLTIQRIQRSDLRVWPGTLSAEIHTAVWGAIDIWDGLIDLITAFMRNITPVVGTIVYILPGNLTTTELGDEYKSGDLHTDGATIVLEQLPGDPQQTEAQQTKVKEVLEEIFDHAHNFLSSSFGILPGNFSFNVNSGTIVNNSSTDDIWRTL